MFKVLAVARKVCALAILLLQRAPVFGLPAAVFEFHLTDQAVHVLPHRDAEPLRPQWAFDAIAVAPVVFGELQIVVKHKEIDAVNDVEVALPGDVVGLQHSHPPLACGLRQSGDRAFGHFAATALKNQVSSFRSRNSVMRCSAKPAPSRPNWKLKNAPPRWM